MSKMRSRSLFPNLNGVNGKDLYSDTGVSVRLQGFLVFVLTCHLCSNFNDSYRILMPDQCLLKPPGVFRLAVRIKPLVTGTEKNKCLSDRRTNGYI